MHKTSIKSILLINNIKNSGPARGCFAIYNGLNKEQNIKYNFETIVVSLGKKPKKIYSFAKDKYFKIKYLNTSNPIQFLKSIFSYFQILHKFKPDIVISTGLKSDLVNCINFGNFSRITIVRASSYKESILFNYKSYLFKKLLLFINYLIAGYKDVVIYFNEDMIIKDSINYFKKPKKFDSIQNFIDEYKLSENKLNKIKSKKRTNLTTFLTIGSLINRKRIDKMINAIYILNKNKYNSELIIIGDGPLKNNLLKLANDLNLKDKIHFLGQLDNPVPFFYKVDAFVMSSVHEGMPRSAMEALFFNVPIILPKLEGFDRLVNKKNGLLYNHGELYEKLVNFIENNDNYKEVELPCEFKIKTCIKKFVNILINEKKQFEK